MATYAIGDIQGCFDSFTNLLERIRFRSAHDRLWLVGDLVNRGPKSLETLRLIRSLGSAAQTVLGNHDLYLLMVAEGGAKFRGKDDTLQDIFDAPDCVELLDWLRHQPLCILVWRICNNISIPHLYIVYCQKVYQFTCIVSQSRYLSTFPNIV